MNEDRDAKRLRDCLRLPDRPTSPLPNKRPPPVESRHPEAVKLLRSASGWDENKSRVYIAQSVGVPERYQEARGKDFDTSEMWTRGIACEWETCKYDSLLHLGSTLILGGNGVGKTHLASSLAIDLLCLFKGASQVQLDMRSSNGALPGYLNAPLMVIDDVTAVGKTDFGMGLLLQVVSFRYDKKLPTIYTTFSSMSEIENMDSSLASRLGGCEMTVRLKGPDRRIS